MDITSCLLDIGNQRLVCGESIGSRVRRAGRTALWNDRPGSPVDTVVIHYISACNFRPDNPFGESEILTIFTGLLVSSHFLVGRDGHVLRLVPEAARAWHAGGSIMPAPDLRRGVNDFSIGIELVATPYSGFTEAQYLSTARLCCILSRNLGRTLRCVGHDDIAGQHAVDLGLRRDVKHDPGPLFDWGMFRGLVARGPGS